MKRAHCKQDPAAVGACGGTDETCSCECFGCMPENRPDYEPEETSEPSAEDKAAHERWSATALCYGFNELAKMAKTLGEKVYFRMARDAAEQRFIELGGQKFITSEAAIATLDVGLGMPSIAFRPQDIELMRETVAIYDAAQNGDQTKLQETVKKLVVAALDYLDETASCAFCELGHTPHEDDDHQKHDEDCPLAGFELTKDCEALRDFAARF